MKKGTLLILLLFSQVMLFAAPKNRPGGFGMGLILGSTTGISAKYWLGKGHAFDVAIGLGDFSVHADYLWHSWYMLPQPQRGLLATYCGLGAKIRNKDPEFGIRAVGGIAYNFPRHPVELFLELVPVLELAHDPGLGIDAGMGIRFYFK